MAVAAVLRNSKDTRVLEERRRRRRLAGAEMAAEVADVKNRRVRGRCRMLQGRVVVLGRYLHLHVQVDGLGRCPQLQERVDVLGR